MSIKAIILGALLSALSPKTFSAVIWDWSIDNPSFSVGSTDNIVVTATLFNDPASDVLSELDTNQPNEVIDILPAIGTGDTALFDNYNYDEGEIGIGTIRSQFDGVVINPGEYFNFILYSLIPVSSGALPGTYEMTINELYLTASSQGYLPDGPVNITVVPIPSALYLFITGMIALTSLRKNTRT